MTPLATAQDTNANAYELSEMYLYVVELLVTNGDNEAALQQLDKNADAMVDKHGRSELRAKALLNLGRVRRHYTKEGRAGGESYGV